MAVTDTLALTLLHSHILTLTLSHTDTYENHRHSHSLTQQRVLLACQLEPVEEGAAEPAQFTSVVFPLSLCPSLLPLHLPHDSLSQGSEGQLGIADQGVPRQHGTGAVLLLLGGCRHGCGLTSSPPMITWNLSVVGSGPTRQPWKLSPSRYLGSRRRRRRLDRRSKEEKEGGGEGEGK